MRDSVTRLNRDIVSCQACPRLIKHCQKIASEKRKAYQHETYWGKPVPNFGDTKAQLLIVGLAPAAHGANRTGRMFTGDRSGLWLYRALYRAGFANQAECDSADDGLQLKNAVITSVAHCAPPDNKPTTDEIKACEDFFARTMAIYDTKVILALGGIAWNAVIHELKRQGKWTGAKPAFGHGAEVKLADGRILLGSYHPSQQNTFTGRLTEEMLDSVFDRARKLCAKALKINSF